MAVKEYRYPQSQNQTSECFNSLAQQLHAFGNMEYGKLGRGTESYERVEATEIWTNTNIIYRQKKPNKPVFIARY